MKKLAILVAFLILVMVPITVFAGHDDDDDNGKLVLSDAYLSSGAFTANYGPGSLDSVLDLEKLASASP